jgi:hypothetical protein
MNKQDLKNYIEEKTSEKIESNKKSIWSKIWIENQNKFWRRINTICRSSINRLSYELKYDNGKIYLLREGRERLIECKSKNINLSTNAFLTAEKLLKEAKEKFI